MSMRCEAMHRGPIFVFDQVARALLLIGMVSCMVCSLSACGNGGSDDDSGNQNQLSDGSASQAESSAWAKVPLPDIAQQPVRFRVASVVNTRFKQLSESQLQKILLRTQELVKQYFDVDIEFFEVETLSIEDMFEYLDPVVVDARSSEIVDIDYIDEASARQSREQMQQSLFATMSGYAGNRQAVLDYAQPYLLYPEIKEKDFIGLSYALVDTLIARLQYWKSETAEDAAPVLDASGYNQWVWWDSLGYSDMPYDVVITNQLVASAEYYAMDVHSSLRGGLTAGTTSYAKNTRLNTYAYIMLYPMLNDTALLTRLRDDETYSEQQIINYSAALLSHELGHMLLHLGHPFGDKACIMSPTVMLHYRDWYQGFDAGQCAVGSSKQMVPGSANIDYNRSW